MRTVMLALLVVGVMSWAVVSRAELVPDTAEFQVNTYTTNGQYDPAVSPLAPDEFVIVWSDYYRDGHSSALSGQRIDAQGAKIGTEFQVNTYSTGYQDQAAVAGAPDGKFFVVWRNDPEALNGGFVAGRLYDSNGDPLGPQFTIQQDTVETGVRPAVARVADGDFVVVWQHSGFDTDQSEVYGRRVAAIGGLVGNEFRVNSYTTSFQDRPQVASHDDGSFVVVWGGRSTSANADIFAQRFDTAGAPAGTELRVNTYTAGQQLNPRVARRDDGGFVVVWLSDGQDGDREGVFGQQFDSAGEPAGTEFQVNAFTTGRQGLSGLDVAYDTETFVVTWSTPGQDGDGSATVARRFSSDGSSSGTEFVVNAYTTSAQSDAVVASDGSDGFVVVWESYTQDGSYDAIVGRHLAVQEVTTTTLATTTTLPSDTTTTLPPSTTTTVPSATTTTLGSTTTSIAETTTTSVADTTTTSAAETTTTTVASTRICGDGNGDQALTASDALFALRSAVGSSNCELCVCDVNSSGGVTATDALTILQRAVGQPRELVCVAC